jgi:hypothetical protein
MPLSQLPTLLSAWLTDITAALDCRSAPRLLLLFVGALFAKGRRTVTSWFLPAGINTGFRRAYSTLWSAGRRVEALSYRLLGVVLKPLMRRAGPAPLRFAIDDTPTARYCPCVQGTGIHHNPTPGPVSEKFVYGHVWVCLAWLARHSAWDTLALPLRALLYVRAKNVPALAKHYPWTFHTKLQLAAELVRWLKVWLGGLDNKLWLAVDGAYAKRPFLKPVLALGVVVFSRLRKDAHLLSLPPTRRRRGQRGPRPRYGKERIHLVKRVGHKRGWQRLACWQYGVKVVKQVKTFLATWRPAGGLIRVVLVREETGWLAYFCTDPSVSTAEVLEVMAERTAIEQTFKDVKEVWGAGQQQVRNIYANLGAMALNLIWYS